MVKTPIGIGARWPAACVLPLWLLLAMSVPGLAQPRGPGPRKPRGVDRQALESWKQLKPEERRVLAGRFLQSSDPGRRGKHRSPEFRIFREAIRTIPREEWRESFQRPFEERVQKLVELTDRFVRDALSRRIRNEIPGDLRKLLEAGFISKEEVQRITSMQDQGQQFKAYFRLRNEVFLRQMVKTGRIDEATHRRIMGLENMRDRFRELSELRRKAFHSVNAHLIHFMLRPFERVKLLKTRWSPSFYRRVRSLEKRKGIRFLDIFPSADPKRLSHLLRMSPEHERRMSQDNLTPEERRATAQEIFTTQRAAFVDALVRRVGEDRARRVKEASGPQSFYPRAFHMLIQLGEIEPGHRGPPPWGPGGQRKPGERDDRGDPEGETKSGGGEHPSPNRGGGRSHHFRRL